MQKIIMRCPFKGTVSLDGFFAHCILFRIERKDLKICSSCAIIYWVRARLTHLAQKENINFLIKDAISHCLKF